MTPTHIAAVADELLTHLGATIADPGPSRARILTTPTGRTHPLPPRCECPTCGPHPDRPPDL
jgi:hypothetical protein